MESKKYHFRQRSLKIVEVLGKAQFPCRKRRLKAQIFADYFHLVSVIKNSWSIARHPHPKKFVHWWQTSPQKIRAFVATPPQKIRAFVANIPPKIRAFVANNIPLFPLIQASQKNEKLIPKLKRFKIVHSTY